MKKTNTQEKINSLNKKIQISVSKDQERLHKEISKIRFSIRLLTLQLEKKEKEERILYNKFQKLFKERDALQEHQKKIRGLK